MWNVPLEPVLMAGRSQALAASGLAFSLVKHVCHRYDAWLRVKPPSVSSTGSAQVCVCVRALAHTHTHTTFQMLRHIIQYHNNVNVPIIGKKRKNEARRRKHKKGQTWWRSGIRSFKCLSCHKCIRLA
jgi:hypothetical protein